MGSKVLEYIIAAKDKTGAAISSAMNRIKTFASSVATNLTNIKSGLDMAVSAVTRFSGLFSGAIREAFKFEKAHTDFTGLLNSVDAAKAHIADLKQFASSTPLTFDDLAKASKLLLSFGSDVNAVMPNLKMLGDIAMGDSTRFQGLALVFAQVQSTGKLMGQDLLQMINQGFNPLTVIAAKTGKSVSELKDIMSEGGISFDLVAEAMRTATSEGGLFCGAMEAASKTGEGLTSTLQDKWTEAVRTFGEAFSDTAKGGLQLLIDKLTELVENGDVEVWANRIAETFTSLIEKTQAFVKPLAEIAKFTHGLFASTGAGIGGFIGTLAGGGSFGEAWTASDEYVKQTWTDTYDLDGTRAAKDSSIRRAAIAKRRAAKAAGTGSANTAVAAPALSMTELLEQGQADARAAKDAEKYAKEYEKALEAAAKEAAKAEEDERKAMEKRIADERTRLNRRTIREYSKALQEAQADESAASQRLSAAQAAETQAWGWYRNRDSWKEQLADERADAKAEIQFQKEFKSLTRKANWRTRDLSDDEEIVRRVGLAREETAAAQQWAQQTALAAERAADALEQIQNDINDGGYE